MFRIATKAAPLGVICLDGIEVEGVGAMELANEPAAKSTSAIASANRFLIIFFPWIIVRCAGQFGPRPGGIDGSTPPRC